MSTGYNIGDSAYRNRREAIAGEIGRWTSELITDVEAAAAELLTMAWFDESLGEVEPDEVRDGIEAHNDYLRERGVVATESDDDDEDESSITAEVTGRGAASTVPEDPTAVDAAIYVAGIHVGMVTLRVDHDGDLATWGSCPDHWADPALLDWLDGQPDRREAVASVVGAVRAAAAAETSTFAIVDLDDASPPTLRALVREQISRRALQAATHEHYDGYWRLDVYRDGSLSWQESVSGDEQTIDEEADGFKAIPTLAYVGTGSCKCHCEACNNPDAADPEEYDHSDAVEWIERDMERALDEIAVGYFDDEDEDGDEDEDED